MSDVEIILKSLSIKVQVIELDAKCSLRQNAYTNRMIVYVKVFLGASFTLKLRMPSQASLRNIFLRVLPVFLVL